MTPYIDNQLSEDRVQHIRRHLDNCPHCRALYDRTREIIELGSSLPEVPLANGFHERLMQRLFDVRTEPVRQWRPQRVLAPLAAALLLVFIGRSLLVSGLWQQMPFKSNNSSKELTSSQALQPEMATSDEAPPERRDLAAEPQDEALRAAKGEDDTRNDEWAGNFDSVEAAGSTAEDTNLKEASDLSKSAAYESDFGMNSALKMTNDADASCQYKTKSITYPSVIIVTLLTAMAAYIMAKFIQK